MDGEIYDTSPDDGAWEGTSAQVGLNPVSDKFRAFVEFDTSSVDDGCTVSELYLNLSVGGAIGALSTDECTVSYLSSQPSLGIYSNITLWTDMGNGTALNLSSPWCKSLGVKNINITAGAAELQNRLSEDWFGIGVKSDEVIDADWGSVETVESGNDPKLIVSCEAAGDTCTAPTSGDWTVDASDGCVWSSDQTVLANMTIEGTGTVHLSASLIFNATGQQLNVHKGSTLVIYEGGSIK